jgi:hypothetical protein
MSLAFYASEYNASPIDKQLISPIDQKRNGKRTLRNRESFTNSTDQKIQNMRREIGFDSIDEEDSGMSDFNPPPMPTSMGAQKTIDKSPENIDIPRPDDSLSHNDSPVETFQNMPTLASDEYYNQVAPYYNNNGPGQGQGPPTNKDALVEKLDYLIHMLEDQKDIKTDSVTEELILYSFLGVFIIFVLDSFAKTGKYMR